ncbi:Rdx family protein [bacterium]|nr:Rdx family protein [bacterium]
MAKIKEEVNITEKLIPSSGGVFEVKANGKLIFSKRRSGRFPEKDEIVKMLIEQ